jgi:hypothetical protein
MNFSCEHGDERTKNFMLHTGSVCRPSIFDSTTAFYAVQNGELKQCGSATLLELGDKNFILTAAHTFDALTALNLPTFVTNSVHGAKLIPFNKVGICRPNTKDPFHRTDDPFDICVGDLPAEIVNELKKGKRFLHLNQLDPFERVNVHSWYCALGYPTEMNQSDYRKRALSYACTYNTFLYRGERGLPERFDHSVEILLDFHEDRNTNDDGTKGPLTDPHGMSGCGIWRLAQGGCVMEAWKPEDIRLVGIQHGWDTVHHVLRGTRVGFAIQMIYKSHADLRQAIEFHYGPQARLF